MKYLLFIFLNYIPILSLAGGDEQFVAPNSSPQEILKYAQQFILDRNIPLNEIELKVATYSYTKQRWDFYYYWDDSPTKHGFVIIINDINPHEIEMN